MVSMLLTAMLMGVIVVMPVSPLVVHVNAYVYALWLPSYTKENIGYFQGS